MKNLHPRLLTLCLSVLLMLCPLALGAQSSGETERGALPPPPPVKPVPSEFDTLWVPGFSGGVLVPFHDTGLFAGGSIRFDLLYGLDSKRRDAFFADRGRWEIFADIGLYGNTANNRPSTELLYLWMLGFNLSLETPSTLARNFLIPYIGFELGGITSSTRGSGFSSMPIVGLNLISLPNCTLSVDGALMLNTLAFEDYLGMMVRANLNFTF